MTSDLRPLLLMIHGVNSTLEWSSNVLSVLEPHFQPRLVRYRYFHTIWGPFKVYIWPAALLYLLAYSLMKWGQSQNHAGHLAVSVILLILLLLETGIAVHAEITWSRAVEDKPSVWLPPVVFCSLGVAGVFFHSHPLHWLIPTVCTTAVAIFLDMREYGGQHFNVPALVLLPALFAVGGGSLAWSLLQHTSLTGIGAIAVAAIVEPFLRCRLASSQVSQEIKRACSDHIIPPFVVAHSLGTYLAGHVLHENEQLKLGRILFTGCVLDRRFPLETLVPHGNERLVSLTNHVGRIDLVPVCTGLLRGIWCLLTSPARFLSKSGIEFIRRLIGWRPLGGAGALGFRPSTVVHTMSPIQPCAACIGDRARIHNVDHRWARHSTLNNDRAFQSWYWVPSLWGIDVHDYDRWLSICRTGHFYRQPNAEGTVDNPVSVLKYEKNMLEIQWAWPSSPEMQSPPPRYLKEFVSEVLEAINSSISAEQLMPRIPKFLFDLVAAAVVESKKSGRVDAEIIRFLHPQVALQHAVLKAREAEK